MVSSGAKSRPLEFHRGAFHLSFVLCFHISENPYSMNMEDQQLIVTGLFKDKKQVAGRNSALLLVPAND